MGSAALAGVLQPPSACARAAFGAIAAGSLQSPAAFLTRLTVLLLADETLFWKR